MSNPLISQDGVATTSDRDHFVHHLAIHVLSDDSQVDKHQNNFFIDCFVKVKPNMFQL